MKLKNVTMKKENEDRDKRLELEERLEIMKMEKERGKRASVKLKEL